MIQIHHWPAAKGDKCHLKMTMWWALCSILPIIESKEIVGVKILSVILVTTLFTWSFYFYKMKYMACSLFPLT